MKTKTKGPPEAKKQFWVRGSDAAIFTKYATRAEVEAEIRKRKKETGIEYQIIE
ncbi:hypothetical protein LJC51_07500 [Lachnospiraceae bacterium OttesenSCG-928-J05]|nr:hypothetical protein [Lachnospiraceae bacterium OttesenSCG-928-J05]